MRFRKRGTGPIDDVIEAKDLMYNTAGENMEEESPTSDVPMEDSNYNYAKMMALHGQRRRTMLTFRLNREAGVAMCNMEETAHWEGQEKAHIFL